MAYFDDPTNAVGNVTLRLSGDSELVNKATGDSFAKQLQAISTVVIGVAIALSASWKVTLVILSAFPLCVFIAVARMRILSGQQYQSVSDLKHGDLAAAIADIRTFSALGIQQNL